MRRRRLLQAIGAGSALTLAGCTASPQRTTTAMAPAESLPDWPETAFSASSVEAALAALYGSAQATQTEDVVIDLPVFAEAGAMVPVAASTRLPGAEAIHILVRENQAPLAASFSLTPGTEAFVATRVRVERTSDVFVCVRAAGRLFVNSADVLVAGPDGCVVHKVPS